jgi:hypothetical protein
MGNSCTTSQAADNPKRKRKAYVPTEAERAIIACECAIGFNKYSGKKLFDEIRGCGSNWPVLGKENLEKLTTDLKLSLSDYGNAGTPIGRMFDSIVIEDGYSMDKVVLIALLLSKGSSKDKAVLFF